MHNCGQLSSKVGFMVVANCSFVFPLETTSNFNQLGYKTNRAGSSGDVSPCNEGAV